MDAAPRLTELSPEHLQRRLRVRSALRHALDDGVLGPAEVLELVVGSPGPRADAPVAIEVPAGPGPSIVDLPAPGCWHLDLRWPGGADSVSLRYEPPRPG